MKTIVFELQPLMCMFQGPNNYLHFSDPRETNKKDKKKKLVSNAEGIKRQVSAPISKVQPEGKKCNE